MMHRFGHFGIVTASLGAVMVLGLCLAGSDVFAQAAQGTTPPPLSYEAAVQRAMTANPAIIAARLRRSINIASRDVAA